MKKSVFSVILYIDKMEMLPSALSYLNNEAQMELIQLIIIDPSSTENVSDFSNEFKGEGLIYLSRPDIQMAEAYQEGLGYVDGDYVNFALASAKFSQNAFSCVRKLFQKFDCNMISTVPYFVEGDERTSYKGAYHTTAESHLVHLLEFRESSHVQLLLQAYFFRFDFLKGAEFKVELKEEALYQFLLVLLLKNPEYFYLKNIDYLYTEPLEDNHSKSHIQYCHYWYEDSIKKFVIPLLQFAQEVYEQIPLFLQVSCFYLIYVKIRCNLSDRNKGVLNSKEEVQQFFDRVFQALIYIDNNVILSSKIIGGIKTDRSMCLFLLRGKAKASGKSINIVDSGSTFLAVFNSLDGSEEENLSNNICTIESASDELLKIKTINYDDGKILIDAYTELTDFFSPNDFNIYVACVEHGVEVKTVQAKFTNIYPLIRCFGVTYARRQSIQLIIPFEETKETFRFYYTCLEQNHQFTLDFSSYNSRIFIGADDSYWKFKKGWMLRSNTNNTEIIIEKCGFVLQLKKELKFCRSLSNQKKYHNIYRKGILLRFLYWALSPILNRRRIWISFDKMYKGGDNGEYIFRYVRGEHKEIDMYYVLRKDSQDYRRLKKQYHRHILDFGSIRCQLVFLYAKIILATHVNISAQYNSVKQYNPFTKDLQRGDVICIQHGLSIQKIAQFQNRLFDNTKLYCCESPYEVQNLSHPFYGYQPDQFKLVGLARFDGLKDRNRKIILIAPTWRRNIVNSCVVNIKKTHNNNFKESDYFQIYNRLINDKKLISCAKEYGYQIVYMLHPAVSAQIDDFTKNSFVKIVQGSEVDYEDILCESSLMITDYSGIQFDFAYMRKPIIYYHPDKLPPHYDEGGLVYDTMGFGPICKKHDILIDEICESIRNGCLMDEEYRKRADDFFAFDDHNNCERIFNAVKDYCDSRDSF